MALYGYWRCSTSLQDQERQVIALRQEGVPEEIAQEILDMRRAQNIEQLTNLLRNMLRDTLLPETIPVPQISVDQPYINKIIVEYFNKAILKRVIGTTERPIACLLSGGLDSSLVCALVAKYYGNNIETYSIGLQGSEDLKYADIVAKHLNTKHTNIDGSVTIFLILNTP